MIRIFSGKPLSPAAALRGIHLPTLAKAAGFTPAQVRRGAALLWLGCTIDALPALMGIRRTSTTNDQMLCIARAIGWTARWRVFPESVRPQILNTEAFIAALLKWTDISSTGVDRIRALMQRGLSLKAVQRQARCHAQIVRLVAAADGWSSAWRVARAKTWARQLAKNKKDGQASAIR